MANQCPKCGTSLRDPLPKFCTKCGADLVLHSPQAIAPGEKKTLLYLLGGGAVLTVLAGMLYLAFFRKPPEPDVAPLPAPTPVVKKASEDQDFRDKLIAAYDAYLDYRTKVLMWYPPIYDSFSDPEMVAGAKEARANLQLLWSNLEELLVVVDQDGGADELRKIMDEHDKITDPVVASYLCEREGCPPWVMAKAPAQRGDLTHRCLTAMTTLEPPKILKSCSGDRDRDNITVKEIALWDKYQGKFTMDWLRHVKQHTMDHTEHGYAFANLGYLLQLNRQPKPALAMYNTADVLGRRSKDHLNWVVNQRIGDLYLQDQQAYRAHEHFTRAFYNSPVHNKDIRKRVGLLALHNVSNQGQPQTVMKIVSLLEEEDIHHPQLDYFAAHAQASLDHLDEAITRIERYMGTVTDPGELKQVETDLRQFQNMKKQQAHLDRINQAREEMGTQGNAPVNPDRDKFEGNKVIVAPPGKQPGQASGSRETGEDTAGE